MRALSATGSTLEARNALVFLGAGAGAMVLLADAPHGLAEVQRLFLSSLLCAGPGEVLVAAAFLAAGVAGALRWHTRLLLWATDPASAQAYGSPVRRVDLLVSFPMSGQVASLNAATAGALLLFEIVRQRSGVSGR